MILWTWELINSFLCNVISKFIKDRQHSGMRDYSLCNHKCVRTLLPRLIATNDSNVSIIAFHTSYLQVTCHYVTYRLRSSFAPIDFLCPLTASAAVSRPLKKMLFPQSITFIPFDFFPTIGCVHCQLYISIHYYLGCICELYSIYYRNQKIST